MTCHAVSPVSSHTRRGLLHWMAGTGLAGVAALACRAGTPAARAPEGDSALQREAEADGIVRLQKMAWGSPLEKDTIERGLEVFHAQEQKIRVEYIHTPEDYDNKLQAMLAGGAAPDVFKVSGALYADYIVAGALRDITDQLARDPLLGKPDYFIQPFERERSTYKGRWYGIGSTAQEQILYYNVEVLNQAGVMPPPVDAEKAWEWLPFIQYARQLTVRTGGVAERFGAHWPTGTYGPAVVSNSGMIIDPKTLRYALDRPEAIEAIQQVADLTLTHQVSATAAEMQGGSVLQHLASGRFAMLVGGNWLLLDLAPLGFKYGAGVLPKLKRPATTMTSSTTGIWRDTKKPEAAWRLFRFLNTDDYQLPLVRAGLWNPSHTTLLSPSGIQRWLNPGVHPPGYERLVEYMARYGYADIPVVGIRRASAILNEALSQVWSGRATAATVLREAVPRANQALDEEEARTRR
jgi:multiple sugar transport system substrate-binding protein